uniref:Citramalate synthase n=1 Tax=uncultured bacterium F25-01 TaxID=1191433 RepID=I3VIG9_9BACT|nr:citramalate synthase [uncultured bacterium F25-01]
MSTQRQISVYDTTLRDGTQREGISLSVEDKLKVARRLDEAGFHYVEGGYPGSNPKDIEFFARVGELNLKRAKLVAFGSTRRPDAPTPDANLRALTDVNTPCVCIVAKSWLLHVENVLGTTSEENLRMIEDSVRYLREAGREVIYDAEHFFDGYKDNPAYALATLRAAADAGASWLVLCDTNGGALPDEISAIVRAAKAAMPDGFRLGIHTHNDGELAIANTLAGVAAGAEQVQGTINGYGERTGNANLCSIVPNLQLKLGYRCVADEELRHLTELSRYVAEVANLAHDSHLPFVGASSFAHKAGLHVNAVMKNPRCYEHIVPEIVGNRQRILVSELSGRSNVMAKAEQYGLDLDNRSGDVRRVLETVKQLENEGFQFEAAEASFELLVRRLRPDYVTPFQLVDFLVIVERRTGAGLLAEATVKIRVGETILHTAAEGNGPVSALDAAMRKALHQFYPELADVHLVDYKVRVLDGNDGTGAVVRVSIETSDGRESWGTVGSSPNIIEASWLALVDSLEYALVRGSEAVDPPPVAVPGTTPR